MKESLIYADIIFDEIGGKTFTDYQNYKSKYLKKQAEKEKKKNMDSER